MLHGVINLLTQGSAGTLWCVTRCLAFCPLTNPLTRPEHALLTPRSQTLLTLQLKGLSRGWDVGSTRGSGRPGPWPGISVQTHIPGQGMQIRLASSATSCWVTLSKSPHHSESISSGPDKWQVLPKGEGGSGRPRKLG